MENVMRTFRLFSQTPLPTSGNVSLDSNASHYLLKVLRANIGLQFILFDGSGYDSHVTLVEASKREAVVRIDQQQLGLTESPLFTQLAIGISKGDRMDTVMQKATELGVNRIIPLFTEHGDVKLKADRLDKKMQHWLGVIHSACEQCGRSMVPQLEQPMRLTEYLECADADIKFVLYPTSDQALSSINTPHNVALLVGPEGGLSDTEINQAIAANFTPLQLGPRVLRTETAPLAALTMVQYLWGDM